MKPSLVRLAILALLVAQTTLTVLAGPAAAAGTPASAYEFDTPVAIAADGPYLFAVNATGTTGSPSVTEMLASNGALVRVISGTEYQFNSPFAIVVDEGYVVVANRGGGATANGTLTELSASTGQLVRVLSSEMYHLQEPVALAASGEDVYVANFLGNDLTEVNVVTGRLVGMIDAPADAFSEPDAFAAEGGRLDVLNQRGGFFRDGSVTQLQLGTKKVVRVIGTVNEQQTDHFNLPDAMVAFKGDLFITDANEINTGGNAAEFVASTGKYVRTIGGPSYNYPTAIVVSSATGNAFVANSQGGNVTVFSTATGKQRAVFAAPRAALGSPLALVAYRGLVYVVNSDGEAGGVAALSPAGGRIVWDK